MDLPEVMKTTRGVLVADAPDKARCGNGLCGGGAGTVEGVPSVITELDLVNPELGSTWVCPPLPIAIPKGFRCKGDRTGAGLAKGTVGILPGGNAGGGGMTIGSSGMTIGGGAGGSGGVVAGGVRGVGGSDVGGINEDEPGDAEDLGQRGDGGDLVDR